MSRRRKTSNGQALVLVTFALVAMCGMLGLAVDLGWSFFLKKEAQAAADAAALGAVQEAINRLGFSTSSFTTCPVSPNGTSAVYCAPTAVDCSTFSATDASNLYNGCLYAAQNGFSSATPRQKVTIQANDKTTLPPTAPGINNIVYWVTVRTVQTVPQLFSAVLGNTEGVVSASATAAIVSVVVHGNVILLNRPGDCMAGGAGSNADCGMNIDVQGSSRIVATGPVILSSICNGINQAGCGNRANNPSGSGTNYAGNAQGSALVTGGSITIQNPGAVQGPAGSFSPAPIQSSTASLFDDPTQVSSTRQGGQPPLLAPSGLRTCGLLNGQIAGAGAVVASPYNYYSYHLSGSTRVSDGAPITLNAPGGVTFDAGGTCPGIELPGANGATQSSSAFPTYFFYGGLNASSPATFGAGQYVMVGAAQTNAGAGSVFTFAQNSISGDIVKGTMFIFTAPGYPGLDSQINGVPELTNATANLWQGTVDLQSGNSGTVNLTGLKAGQLPTTALNDFNGVLFWQDRRNSSTQYNADGTVVGPATPAQLTANRVPSDLSSTAMNMQAHPNLSLAGVIYQPRGAYINAQGNGGASLNIMLVSGGIKAGGGVTFQPLPSPNPLTQYINALIQ